MSPATCFVCGKSPVDEPLGKKGGWLEFSEYREVAPEALSHPDGLEYVCGDHLAAARGLTEKSSGEALEELRLKFKDDLEKSTARANPSEPWWWRILARR